MGQSRNIISLFRAEGWKRYFILLFLGFWGLLLGVKIVLPPPENFLVHGIYHWMVVFVEFSLGLLLFTRWAFLAAVGLTGFFFFAGVLLFLFPPMRPCGCLGAVRLGDGVHMLLLGILGAASLLLASELGGFSILPFGRDKGIESEDSGKGRISTVSRERR